MTTSSNKSVATPSPAIDIDALLAKYGPTGRTACKAAPQDKLIRALRARRAPVATIEKILREEFKLELSDSTINKHLNGSCPCAKGERNG